MKHIGAASVSQRPTVPPLITKLLTVSVCGWGQKTASPSKAREPFPLTVSTVAGGEESERCITKRNSSELTGEVHILFTELQAGGAGKTR